MGPLILRVERRFGGCGQHPAPANMPMKALASLFLPLGCQFGSGLCEQSCSCWLWTQQALIPLVREAGGELLSLACHVVAAGLISAPSSLRGHQWDGAAGPAPTSAHQELPDQQPDCEAEVLLHV